MISLKNIKLCKFHQDSACMAVNVQLLGTLNTQYQSEISQKIVM
jgi:hypothetical protein